MKFLEEHSELVASGPGQRTLACEGFGSVTHTGTCNSVGTSKTNG